MRPSQRAANELRPVILTRHFTRYAEGAVLVSMGETRVLCTASIQAGIVPRFLKGSGKGWITAEYSMLPRASHERTAREAVQGHQNGRTQEIQRLIGRALRACVDLKALGENTITIDCDVLQADGGTRCAAITGGCVALIDALNHLQNLGVLKRHPLISHIAACSVGLYQNTPVLDLDYAEDLHAQTDMNIVMNESGQLIEIQGTAEQQTFSIAQLMEMTQLAQTGIQQLITAQKTALAAN